MNGWIKLHRGILDHWVSSEPELLSMWVRLLMEANHADVKKMFAGKLIDIRRGQLIFGLDAFSSTSRISVSKLRRYLKLLESDGMINRQTTNKYSLISIVNYNSYQADDRQTTNKQQSGDNQSTGRQQHRKKLKNDKNDKNPPDPSDKKTIRSKKGRVLSGQQLEAFNLFWDAFNYKAGRAETVDAWIDLGVDKLMLGQIISAAKLEAKRREEAGKDGPAPKMAQGWLSGRRFEDELYQKNTGNWMDSQSGVIGKGKELGIIYDGGFFPEYREKVMKAANGGVNEK